MSFAPSVRMDVDVFIGNVSGDDVVCVTERQVNRSAACNIDRNHNTHWPRSGAMNVRRVFRVYKLLHQRMYYAL